MKPTDQPNPFHAPLNLVPGCRRRAADPDWSEAVDMSDAGDEYLLEFDLPDLAREEIEISLDGDALFLLGRRLSPRTDGRSVRVERPVGAFACRLVLPPDSRSDALYATLQEGVLQLHVPKLPSHKETDNSRTTRSDEPDYEYTHH